MSAKCCLCFSLCCLGLSCVCGLSPFNHVQLFATLWTIAHQSPLSMEFSRQKDWSRLSFPTLGDLPDPGIKPASPASPALAGRFFTTEPPGMLYWRKLYKSKAKSWCGTPPYTADTGTTKQLSSGFGRETISYGKLFSYQGKQQLG